MDQPSSDTALRQHLVALLKGGSAHVSFVEGLSDFPVGRAGERPHGAPHSAWELLEHLRIAQLDIIRFSEGPEYVEPKWPDDYWPRASAPRGKEEWDASVEAVQNDLARFIELISDQRRNLFEPFPWGGGQTLLREALLIADHNAYHLGQMVLLRRLL
jgi:hypothetical protein